MPPRWLATCLPHWNGVLPAHAQAQAKCGAKFGPPHASIPPYRSINLSCTSAGTLIPLSVVISLNAPVSVPSMLDPLSPQMYITSVLSAMPNSSRVLMTRPISWSQFSWNPAYTSICRA